MVIVYPLQAIASEALPLWVFAVFAVLGGFCLLFGLIACVLCWRRSSNNNDQQNDGKSTTIPIVLVVQHCR
jgi:hypothetical protein